MFIRQNKMLLLWIVLVFSSFNGSWSNTVVTYTTKNSEEMQCLIDENTLVATWTDDTTGHALYTFSARATDIENRDLQPKHRNFNYSYMENSHFNLIINKVEREDKGTYSCDATAVGTTDTLYHITVEAIPDEFSLDCFVPPDVTCPAQGVTPTSELICTCAAKGVHPGTLSLDISGADNVQQDSTEANDGLFDLSLTAPVPVTASATEVTCSVNGYNTTEPIPPNLITKTLMISPPTCTLDITFDQDCKGATLNCDCSASPTAGELLSDKGMVYSYFNATGHLIAGNATNTLQIDDVEAGVNLTYSCRGCNGLYYGDSSYVTNSSECTITMVTTTEEPKDDNPKNPGRSSALGAGGIAGIIVGVVAVIIVIVVIAVIVCKKGDDDSKPSDSSVADGNVTATNSNITSSEPPAPVYGVVKKDSKKKSDKLDDNGAGPRGDPEIPAYGVVDKNRTKDPTPAPRSSMRDSKNPSNPKQDGPLELQYAALDHGNKPPSDEVRKPKEEPTEYATVQSVIV